MFESYGSSFIYDYSTNACFEFPHYFTFDFWFIFTPFPSPESYKILTNFTKLSLPLSPLLKMEKKDWKTRAVFKASLAKL